MEMVNHKVNRLGAEASGPLTGADGCGLAGAKPRPATALYAHL
jgi:hypothetical protein